MSSASNRESLSSSAKELSLVDWPLRDQPLRSAAWLLVIAAIALYAVIELGSVSFAMTAAAVMLVCLWRVWIPVRYEFGPRGITQHVLGRSRRIGWRDIARCELRRRGVLLVPDDDSSPAGALRGWFIRYGREERRLRDLIELYLAGRQKSHRDDSASQKSTERHREAPV